MCTHDEGCGISIRCNHQDVLEPVLEPCLRCGSGEPVLLVGGSSLWLQDTFLKLSRGAEERGHGRWVVWRGSGGDGALLGNMSPLLNGGKKASRRGFAGKRGM